MEFIDLIFRLSVVLAIFSFIWGLMRFGFTILRGGVPMSYPLNLALKAIQYFLIVAVSIIFCSQDLNSSTYTIIVTGLILAMYFIGKVQRMQFKRMFVQVQGMQMMNNFKPNLKLEFGIVILSMGLFAFMVMHPEYAMNDITTWFYKTIVDIEKAPIFGFIFKIVGFFFMITILMQMVNAVTFILSGKAFDKNAQKNDQNNPEDPFKFDDYEEVE